VIKNIVKEPIWSKSYPVYFSHLMLYFKLLGKLYNGQAVWRSTVPVSLVKNKEEEDATFCSKNDGNFSPLL
jgi:hypothetical protein